MSINQLGRLNLADLDNYTIHGAELNTGQTYWESLFLESARYATGVIYGGAVTVVAGLTVKVAKGFAKFSTGEFVTWDDQNVILSAADAVNPRIDRIELAYSLANGLADVSNDNDPVTVTKLHTATASGLAGVPAGSPAAPAKTAGRLTMALVSVAALQVALAGGDINSTEDTARDLSYFLLGDSPVGVRYNVRLAMLQYTTDGANWIPIGDTPVTAVTNGTSPATASVNARNFSGDSSGGAVNVNLPAATGSVVGKRFTLAKISNDATNNSFTPNGTDTIDGVNAAVSITDQWAVKELLCIATGKWVTL